MVKLTIVGRVRDGLPIARNLNKENDNLLCNYKQQAEFILQQVSAGALPPSKMTILVDHHSLHYLVANEVCFITLCDSWYPRKLAFHYLQDLHQQMENFDIIDKITRPYTFLKFDGIIGNITKQYVDTRTQANLSKLNAEGQKDVDIVTVHISQILKRRRNSVLPERTESLVATPPSASSIWGSPLLEVVALKWTPISIICMVGAVGLWTTFAITEKFTL